MNIGIFALHFASLALGAGASFITDLFFVVSARTHVLSVRDTKMLMRLNFTALISVVIAIVSDIANMSFQVMDASDSSFAFWMLKILFLCIVFLSLLALRKVHFPALKRHQLHNAHISDSFIHHSDPLVNTAIVSTVTWMFAVVITTFEYIPKGFELYTSAFTFLVLYCITLFATMKFLTYLKDHVTKIRGKR